MHQPGTDLIVFSGESARRERAGPHGRPGRGRAVAASRSTLIARPPIPTSTAIGECALWEGRIFGLVAPGYQMAEVAARHLVGEDTLQFLRSGYGTKAQADGRGRRFPSATRTASTPNALS